MSFNLKRDMGVTLAKTAAVEEKIVEKSDPCPQCDGSGAELGFMGICRRCAGSGMLKAAQSDPPQDPSSPKPVPPKPVPPKPAVPDPSQAGKGTQQPRDLNGVQDLGEPEWDVGATAASSDVDIAQKPAGQEPIQEGLPEEPQAAGDKEGEFSVGYEQPPLPPVAAPEDDNVLRTNIAAIVRGSFDKVIAKTFDFVADVNGLDAASKLAAGSNGGDPSIRKMTKYISDSLRTLSGEDLKRIYAFVSSQ